MLEILSIRAQSLHADLSINEMSFTVSSLYFSGKFYCFCTKIIQNHLLCLGLFRHKEKHCQKPERGEPSHLLNTVKATSGMTILVHCSPAQERHRAAGHVKGKEDSLGIGACHIRKDWEMELVSLENRRLWGILYMWVNIWWEGVSKTETGPFQRCPVIEQVAMSRNWNTGGLVWTQENTFLTVQMTKHWHR